MLSKSSHSSTPDGIAVLQTLGHLPCELLLEVFLQLSPQDLPNVCLTCRFWHLLFKKHEQHIWKTFCLRIYPFPDEKDTATSWREWCVLLIKRRVRTLRVPKKYQVMDPDRADKPLRIRSDPSAACFDNVKGKLDFGEVVEVYAVAFDKENNKYCKHKMGWSMKLDLRKDKRVYLKKVEQKSDPTQPQPNHP